MVNAPSQERNWVTPSRPVFIDAHLGVTPVAVRSRGHFLPRGNRRAALAVGARTVTDIQSRNQSRREEIHDRKVSPLHVFGDRVL